MASFESYGPITNSEGQQFFQSKLRADQIHFHCQERRPRPEPSSTVPFSRDRDGFVDRGDILNVVHEKLKAPAARAALVGLGGVGKSQLAIEYSYRVTDEDPKTWVFWVHASNAARFEESYKVIADRADIPGRDDPKTILRRVYNWLCDKTNGKWLMILDNADESSVFFNQLQQNTRYGNDNDQEQSVALSSYTPQAEHGSILVTSRNKDTAFRLTGSYNNIVSVEPMGQDEALELLEKRLGNNIDRDEANTLAQELDFMPLAMSQAAAYISGRQPRITIQRYIETFRRNDEDDASILNQDLGDPRRDCEAKNAIFTTWQISFEHIRAARRSSADLLSLMSFFDRQGIPEYVLRDVDEKTNKSAEDFEDDIYVLRSYSLITISPGKTSLEMHRLVQRATQQWLTTNDEIEQWRQKFTHVMNQAFPSPIFENWPLCQTLFPHAQTLLDQKPAAKESLEKWISVMTQAARYAKNIGVLEFAEDASRRTLIAGEEKLGRNDPFTLMAMEAFLAVLVARGQYDAAEEISRELLEERQRTLADDHLDTLRSLAVHGKALYGNSKYEAAERMQRRALLGYERALGRDHPDTLLCAGDLASTLCARGKFEAAEEMLRQSLDGTERIFGRDHPDTMYTVKKIGVSLAEQAKYEEAERMFRWALDGRERSLGRDHPLTLNSAGDLALVLGLQARYEEAEKLCTQTLDGQERLLGEDHPETLTSVNNLACLLQRRGENAAAETLSRRAVREMEVVLGREHNETLLFVSNLARILKNQDKHEEAEALIRPVIHEQEKTLGKEHTRTLSSVSTLAQVLKGQGKYTEAENILRDLLVRCENVYGKDHSQTTYCIRELAMALERQSRYEEAKPCARRSLSAAGKEFGRAHPDWRQKASFVARILECQGKDEEAAKLIEPASENISVRLALKRKRERTI